jgi:hypothetical protein
MKVCFAKWVIVSAFLTLWNPGEARSENALFTKWQARLGILQWVPFGDLQSGVRAYPGLQAALHTPYAQIAGQSCQAFAEMGYTYWGAANDQDRVAFNVHIVRMFVGLALPLPQAPWLLPRVGLGYHYLKGERVSGVDEYAFIEDGESEVAWHLGAAIEPETDFFNRLFLVAGFDGIPTQPEPTWLGMLAMGFRW